MRRLKLILCGTLSIPLLCSLCNLQAQVLVHEEPLHHPVFQNNQVRILNVLLPPGDTTQYHIHHTPSVFIFFTATGTGTQLKGATAATSKPPAGSIIYENLAPPHIRVHRVWNTDKDTLHVMDVEILSNDTGFVQKPLTLPGLRLTIDTNRVRVYQLALAGRDGFILSNESRSFVLVSLNTAPVQTEQDGKTQNQLLQPGSFFEIKSRYSFSLKNTGGTAAQFAFLEMPRQ